MNTEQKKMLLKERESLKETSKKNPTLVVIGIVLVIIGIILGYWSGFIILSVELIVGIVLIVIGSRDKEGKRVKEINYLLAGDDAKKVKTTHTIKKYLCAKCDNEIKESDNKCKKCRNFLATDGAVKVKVIEVED